jgi:hypothetical protein
MAQVVDREKAIAEQLLRPEEVCQIGTAEPAAGRAVTGGVQRLVLI